MMIINLNGDSPGRSRRAPIDMPAPTTPLSHSRRSKCAAALTQTNPTFDVVLLGQGYSHTTQSNQSYATATNSAKHYSDGTTEP